MNKLEILQSHQDFIDSDGQFVKALDQLLAAEKYFEAHVTDFLTPDLAYAIEKIAQNVSVVKSGGFQGAERVKLFLTPMYQSSPEIKAHIVVIEVSYANKFNQLAHKDLLGALMSLGIQRKKMGDIVVLEDSFQFAIDASLVDYVKMSLDKVARAGVRLKVCKEDEIASASPITFTLQGTVQSLRLDAIIAMALKCSRSEAQQMIASEKVKLNYRTNTHVSYEVKSGDLVSVRKAGRFKVESILGQTKKDRIRVELSVYQRK